MRPCLCLSPSLAEPNRSFSGCRERSPQPAWSTQAAAGRQTHFDEKRLLRSWDPTIQQLPAWLCLASGESHSTRLCWNQQRLEVSNPVIQPGAASPLLHLQLLLRAGQSPAVLSESEEQSFHSWPFEQQQLFCLCCQAINAGSPPHPPPAPGLEQLPAAPIRLPGCYLSQARLFSAEGTSPSSAPAAATFAGAGHCSLL